MKGDNECHTAEACVFIPHARSAYVAIVILRMLKGGGLQGRGKVLTRCHWCSISRMESKPLKGLPHRVVFSVRSLSLMIVLGSEASKPFPDNFHSWKC